MKRIRKLSIIAALLVCFSMQRANAEELGYTIKDTETLYQACKKAVDEYKDKPQEIGNSVCGAYLYGFMGGLTTGMIFTISKFSDRQQNEFLEKLRQEKCFTDGKPLLAIINNFITWRDQQKTFNDSAFSALYNSMLEHENCKNINQDTFK